MAENDAPWGKLVTLRGFPHRWDFRRAVSQQSRGKAHSLRVVVRCREGTLLIWGFWTLWLWSLVQGLSLGFWH